MKVPVQRFLISKGRHGRLQVRFDFHQISKVIHKVSELGLRV
jgi:hypothetical protein